MNGAAAILQAVRDGDAPAVKNLLSNDPALVRATRSTVVRIPSRFFRLTAPT